MSSELGLLTHSTARIALPLNPLKACQFETVRNAVSAGFDKNSDFPLAAATIAAAASATEPSGASIGARRREQDRGLSAGEKRMLAKARQILVSELALAEHTNEDKAEALLDEVLAC